MIKVTFKDNNKRVVDFIIKKGTQHLYAIDSQHLEQYAYSVRKIEKIEKQVKNCTNEEIYKWAENKYGEQFVEVVIRRRYIYVRLYYSETDKFDTIEYKYEDYIDITSIVKGE